MISNVIDLTARRLSDAAALRSPPPVEFYIAKYEHQDAYDFGSIDANSARKIIVTGLTLEDALARLHDAMLSKRLHG